MNLKMILLLIMAFTINVECNNICVNCYERMFCNFNDYRDPDKNWFQYYDV